MRGIILNRELEPKIELAAMPDPQLNAGEALVRIKAAALNHRDEWCRQGLYPNLSDGIVLGSDGAGIVEKVAEPANSSWIGKEVIINPAMFWGSDQRAQSRDFKILGMPRNGTLAEFISIPVDRLHEKPAHLSWEEAAALPLAGLTAYRALVYQGQATAGDQVLVTGIGGGVAQFAAQYAVALGAKLSVSSSSNAKLEKGRSLGAEQVYNYLDLSWVDLAVDATGGFDVIIDGAAGDSLNQLIHACKPGGRIVLYGATTGLPGKLEARKVYWNQLKIMGSTMGSDRDFQEMLGFVKSKNIRPEIDRVFKFDEAAQAFDRMKAGDQFGKIVLTP
jgi:NADPH:quinone reductase-like Zn-dependent oxidoreductase